MLDVFPVAFLPKDHALAIAIMSYNGGLNFGLLGDFDALPDIERFAEGIERVAGRARRARRGATTAPTTRRRRAVSG